MKHKGKHNQLDKEIEKNIIDPIVNAAVSEREPSELETEDHYKKRLKNQMLNAMHKFQDRLSAGVKSLEKYHKFPNDSRIKNTIELIKDQEKWTSKIKEGKTLSEIFAFTQDEIIGFYEVASDVYHKASYHEASNIFLLLTQLNPTISSFWIGLGAAEEKCGEIQDASHAYILAAELDQNTLNSYLHAAKCFMMLHDNEKAKMVLNRGLERAGTNEKHHAEKEKISNMLNSIK